MPIADLDMAFGKHHQADRPWHLCLSDTDGRARRESVGILHSGDHDGIDRKLTVLGSAPLLEPQPALRRGSNVNGKQFANATLTEAFCEERIIVRQP